MAALLTLLCGLVAFKFLGGFGFALMLLAAWGLVVLAAGGSVARGGSEPGAAATRLGLCAIAFGLGYLLLRLFLEAHGGEAAEEQLGVHYTAVGALLGALIPFLLAAHAGSIWRMMSAGVVAAAAPGVVIVIWGAKAATGFLAGLALAPALLLVLIPLASASAEAGPLEELVRSWGRRLPLLSVAMGMAAVQFSDLVLPLYQMARLHKIIVVAAAAAVFLLWLLADIMGQVLQRAREARAPQSG
jgi:hypothetical protein